MSDITKYDGQITYNGVTIGGNDYVTITAASIDNAPKRMQEFQDVPLRNGGFLLDDGWYANVPHSYGIIIRGNSDKSAYLRAAEIKQALLGEAGYHELTDSWNSVERYEAYLPDGITLTATPERNMIKGLLNFERKPQRFLTSGDTGIAVASGATLTNAWMPSKPKIRVSRSGSSAVTGTVTVGGYTLTATIPTSATYIDIDCDSGEMVFSGGSGASANVTCAKLPVLEHGETAISATKFSSVIVWPRWWRL